MQSETQNSRDVRMEKLWQILDTKKEGCIDLNGLKKGLKNMDHREFTKVSASGRLDALHFASRSNASPALKNADPLLQDVLKAVDTSGDGKIQFEGRCMLDS
jgi:solute carrier family 25 (mitochondrial phosphate transporter), member 23/24/25/41